MKIEKYSDFDMMAIDVANAIAGDLTAALQHEDRVLFAVPGGSTPGPIFDDLCAADLDWSRVDVILTDERWVPADSPRSNTTLLRERLLVNRASKARLLPLYADAPQPEDAISGLIDNLTGLLPIDVAVLGMGPDMHTASLFPDSDELVAALDSAAPVLLPVRPKSQPEARVTLAAHVLNGALRKHVVFRGKEKYQALDAARHLPAKQAPIRAVMDGATVHWTE
ncbi:6-phosphogluconolactonase [Cognatishimia sp. WU-CL00825]|uniref:6-phosphogluconolactonase n=1 Tax=Cognatishimia sp. WU-CL00825 TaxID=3127658 RepID=UPI0031049877